MDTTWFKDLLRAKKLSQRSLAKMLDLDPAAVSLMFRGKRRMGMKEAVALSKLLGVGIQEVNRRAGIAVEEDVHRLRVTFSTDSTSKVSALPTDLTFDFLSPAGCPVGSYGIQVRDPRDLRDHSIYIVSADSNSNFLGRSLLAHIETDKSEHYLGYLCKGYARNTYQLISTDGHVLFKELAAKVVRPVLWISPLGSY